MKKYFVVVVLIVLAGTIFSIKADAAPSAPAAPAAAPVVSTKGDAVGYSSFSANSKYIRSRVLGSAAVLLGWQYNHFETKDFSIGGVGYIGEITGANGGSMAIGGLHFAYTGMMSPFWGVVMGGMMGASGASFRDTRTGAKISTGGVAVEPELGIRINFGKRSRMAGTVGYHWQPTNNAISGPSGTVKFEFINPLD